MGGVLSCDSPAVNMQVCVCRQRGGGWQGWHPVFVLPLGAPPRSAHAPQKGEQAARQVLMVMAHADSGEVSFVVVIQVVVNVGRFFSKQ